MKHLLITQSDKIKINITNVEDIEDYEKKPHPYGFYFYEDSLKDSTAFNRLKKVMIEDKEERIETLKQEIKQLKGTKYNDI